MPMQYIRCVFKSRGVSQCGCCSFSHVLPLLEVRSRARIPEGARTVIFALFPYYTGLLPHRNLSRYAVPDDYHLIAGRVLEGCQDALEEAFPQERFVSFVDSSPIREVQGAYLAGLGWMGRNGQLINPRFGSYVYRGNCDHPGDSLPAPPYGEMFGLRGLPEGLPHRGADRRERGGGAVPVGCHPEKRGADLVGNGTNQSRGYGLGVRHLQRRLPNEPAGPAQ